EAQQGLAAAAGRPDPVPSVLRRLAGRLDGWAVLYGPEGTRLAAAGREPGEEVRLALAGLADVVRPDVAPGRDLPGTPAGAARRRAPGRSGRGPLGRARAAAAGQHARGRGRAARRAAVAGGARAAGRAGPGPRGRVGIGRGARLGAGGRGRADGPGAGAGRPGRGGAARLDP